MTQSTVNQIIVATVSTVAAAMIVDYFNKRNQPAPPVSDNTEKSWWSF